MTTAEKDAPLDGEMFLTRDEFLACFDKTIEYVKQHNFDIDIDRMRVDRLRFEAKWLPAFLLHDWWSTNNVVALNTDTLIGACGCLVGTVRHDEDPEDIVPEAEYVKEDALDEAVGARLDYEVIRAINIKYSLDGLPVPPVAQAVRIF